MGCALRRATARPCRWPQANSDRAGSGPRRSTARSRRPRASTAPRAYAHAGQTNSSKSTGASNLFAQQSCHSMRHIWQR
eukprot:7238517-Pyramimonas_sp.AAC.1